MKFSPLIVGTMRWSSWGVSHPKPEIQTLIESCLDLGLYTFDSADIYGGYTWEESFGKALGEMNLPRQSYQLISKGGIKYKGGARPYEVKAYDLSKDYLIQCVEQSLKDLKTEYLDLFLLHRPSPLMDPEEIAAAFSLLRSSGKVLNFGVSNFSTLEFDFLSKYFPALCTNQIEISLTQSDAFFDGRILQQQSLGLQPTAWSPLGSYFSSDDEKSQRTRAVLIPLSEKYGASEAELLLSFLRKSPAGIIPIVGSSKVESIQKLARSLDLTLSDEDWFVLLEASRGRRVL
ncbi:aldo/keto reductase [Chryseobacterium sp. A301]